MVVVLPSLSSEGWVREMIPSSCSVLDDRGEMNGVEIL